MNAFYAKVAAEAEAKCTAPSKDGSDLDDWLEGFDFDEKQAQKAKIPVSKFATEASLGDQNPKFALLCFLHEFKIFNLFCIFGNFHS